VIGPGACDRAFPFGDHPCSDHNALVGTLPLAPVHVDIGATDLGVVQPGVASH
jgi:hypothetical protein